MKIIDEILNKAKSKADSVEVFYTATETTSCDWSSDKLKMATANESSGLALRVMVNGKCGFYATSKIDDPDQIVNAAIELAPLGSEFAGELPSKYEPADVSVYDEETSGVTVDRIVGIGNGMIEKAKSGNSEAMYDSTISRSIINAVIANSNGTSESFRKTSFSGYLSGQIAREGDVLMNWEFDNSPKIGNQPDKWATDLVETLNKAKNIVQLPAGEYKCILTPKAMGMFNPLKLALNARMVLKDMSPFKNKVGEKVFDKRITFFDDGLNPDMVASQPIDDEGVTSQKTMLIENGVLKQFIHDLHTSKLMGVAPTGNGMRAGLSAAPRAGFTTLTLEPGEKTLAEMISGIDKGILIDQIMGAHQASPFSGDFSVSIGLGFVIENGEIIGRFKNGMLAGNCFRMFDSQVLEIGSELRNVEALVPPVLFDRMPIATGG